MIGFFKFIVFVAIVGILAVVVFPKIGTFIGMDKSHASSTQLNNVQTVATEYLQSTVSAFQQLLSSR